MKWDQTGAVVAVMPALAVPAQLRLAQDRLPSPQQPPQQKEEPQRSTLATANYKFMVASAFLFVQVARSRSVMCPFNSIASSRSLRSCVRSILCPTSNAGCRDDPRR
jgi:hypothetical protein